jgi:hypothetical protein
VLAGPDHLAAVAPLALEPRRAGWVTGLRWGIGHSAGVALVALAALALRDLLPLEQLSLAGERAVGLVLIGLGVWGFYGLMSRRPRARDGALSRTALLVGALHGLAGSAHLIGVLPALALPTADAVAWVGGFALGTIAAMAGFAASLGSLTARFHRPLVGLSSAAAVLIGVWWLLG